MYVILHCCAFESLRLGRFSDGHTAQPKRVILLVTFRRLYILPNVTTIIRVGCYVSFKYLILKYLSEFVFC